MAWASMDQVVQWTGRTCTQESLALAQTMIETFAGTTTEASDAELIASKNLRKLGQAVAFQAVWLDAHPDVLEGVDVEGVSQDGLNAQYAHANAHLLAPLAKRCLDRLSWMREIRASRGMWSRRRAIDHGNRDSAVADDRYEWGPLPFGATPGPSQR
jgi:hypothetical protein